MTNEAEQRPSIEPLVKPRAVAVIGASDDPARIGGRPLHYLRHAGFPGAIYPVNPKRERVQGLPSYPSIGDVPGEVDVAVVAVPAPLVADTVADCAARGVRATVVFSAGFAETGETGEAEQRRLAAIARDSGMRILGPNCLGVYNASLGFYATFTSTFEAGYPVPGRVALLSQSGAYGSHLSLVAARRGIGIRYWITTGNECDVELAECIAYAADDPGVAVIAAYAEGARDGEALLGALSLARARRKPVLFMKVGTSAIGAAAAASHTAALAGADAVYEGALRQYGAYRVRDTEEMLDLAYACERGVLPPGPRIGLLTVSGGVGIQMADTAVAAGLDVSPMPEAAQARLKALLPFAAPRNPVDATAQVFNDPELIGANLDLMLAEGGYDAVVAFLTFVAAARSMVDPVRRALHAARERYSERLIVLVIVAPPGIVRAYEDAGCLVFEDPTRAVRAVAALWRLRAGFERLPPTAAGTPEAEPAPLPESPLGERESKRILAAAGIPVVDERLVGDADAAARAAEVLGFPVVLKIASSDIAHKTEVGGVLLDVRTAEAAREGFEMVMARAREGRPEARIEGVLVAPKIAGGVEMILGVQRDPLFGPVVMAGMGGIFVEVLEDVRFRVAPIDEDEARRMVGELAGYAVLAGMRGKGPYDVDALCRALAALSRFAAAHARDLESADINPFVVLPRGGGALAVDALLITRRE